MKRKFQTLVILLFILARDLSAQSPLLRLDTTFLITAMPSLNQQSPNTSWLQSAHVLPDGKILVSGRLHYYDPPYNYGLGTVRLNPDGSRDMSFPSRPGYISRLWQNRLYTGSYPRRYFMNGDQDTTFDLTDPPGYNFGPYTYTFEVLDDGSVIIGGSCSYNYNGDPDNVPFLKIDSTGLYDVAFLSNLLQYSPIGTVFDLVKSLSSGQFMVGGGSYSHQGQSWGTLVRFFNDGHLDTTFKVPFQGKVHDVIELPDGKYLVGGRFSHPEFHDSLNVARLEHNGALDESFFNWNDYTVATGGWSGNLVYVYGITPFNDNFIVTGNFGKVQGIDRGCVAVIDSNGYVVPDGIAMPGASGLQLTNYQTRAMSNAVVTPDGVVYVMGIFHGYADDMASDMDQLAMVRLIPLSIPLEVAEQGNRNGTLDLYPNPTTGYFRFSSLAPSSFPIDISIHDRIGRSISRTTVADAMSYVDVSTLATGIYSVSTVTDNGVRSTSLLMIE